MKFDYISQLAPLDLVSLVKDKISSIFLELGTREDNHHVGSGRGGNGLQLLCLMDMRHILTGCEFNKVRIDPINQEVIWGAPWVKTSSRASLRTALDNSFDELWETHPKFIEKIRQLNDVYSSRNINNYISRNADKFPKLSAESVDPKKCSPTEQLLLASSICQDLAHDLDVGNTDFVSEAGEMMSIFPAEIILMSIRQHIQIDRLVKHNLDEHPAWRNLLGRINRRVDGE